MTNSHPDTTTSWQTAARRWVMPGIIIVFLLTADQLLKLWAIQTLGPEPGNREIFLIGSWFSLVYVQNTGVAFGLFQDFTQVFTITALLISAGAIYAYLFHLPNGSPWVQLCIGLIIGGALGNVIDRIRLNYVIDFIRVGWWPVFNIADSAITVGVVMLAIYLLFTGDDEAPRPAPGDDRLLDELLNQDIVPGAEPPRRLRSGRTDSGRYISDNDGK